ncbi:hypothetical protein ACE193_21345 [Bernardetia sp. OM2101]|uniref:hypothetical protein n=1 Tax=Bernardetia sp. OM2101 TaxID=3344876 RepID=UPI0035CFFD5C
MDAQIKKQLDKHLFVYPAKIEDLFDPIFYTITNEEVEVEGSFEGVENEYFIELAGVKILLKEAVNTMLAKSKLAKDFIGLFERNSQMRTYQKSYFKNRRKMDLANSKKAENTNDNFIEVCRPTYKVLKKFNQD